MSVARLEGVSAGYGPFRALFEVDLEVEEGTVVVLLGANGAGKSTVARVLSGLVEATAGRVLVDDADATGWSAVRVRRAGVLHVPEGRGVFSSLSVAENLTIALSGHPRRERRRLVDEALGRFAILGERSSQRAGTLSGGQQRLLSLAAALVSPPRLLVLDEISLGLAPNVLDEIYRSLEEIRSAGTAMLLIEQHTGRALELADAAVLLRRGRVAFVGSPEDAAAAIGEPAGG